MSLNLLKLTKTLQDVSEETYKALKFTKEDDLEPQLRECAKDVMKQRKRLGGNWIIDHATPTRKLREMIKSTLNNDVIFIVLNVKKKLVSTRLSERHGNETYFSKKLSQYLAGLHKYYEPAGKDEENTFNVDVTQDISKEELVQKILKIISSNK